MERINNLIRIQQQSLETQREQLNQLQKDMADPKSINDKGNTVNEYKNELQILKDLKDLMKENNNDANAAMEIMKSSLQDIKEDSSNYRNKDQIVEQAIKDEQVIDKYALELSDRQDTTDIVQDYYSPFDDLD